MTPSQPGARPAGPLIPLFSIPSSRSWGIGEIRDIASMVRWLETAGLKILQLLPINEMPPGETSPHSALSAMGIDPQFITMDDVEDFAAIGGEDALEPALRARLDAARVAPRIQYAEVRGLKNITLRRCFAQFRSIDLAGGTNRAAAFRAYLAEQGWWLDDYALFRALHACHGELSWSDWPEPLRAHDEHALASARAELSDEILFRQYLQWLAGERWGGAR